MSQDQESTSRQARPSDEHRGSTGRTISRAEADQWSHVIDPNERRKIQNKLAQRRFRDKTKEHQEETERQAENQRNAGNSYMSPKPEAIDTNDSLSGLPWGGINMRYIIETGRRREQHFRQSSLANSLQNDVTGSRVGLHLSQRFARGSPAWHYLRDFPYHEDDRVSW
ncbi:hypothetical protein NX059_007195 [Plenodomus lindquistii]|nr:hypothetical protein NX059_007195 [Plenodomus lindquistii]